MPGDAPVATREIEWDAANCLRVDHATVEAVEEMLRAGVRPVLLKGPVVANWLYSRDPSRRAYNDADLLVAPNEYAAARNVLAGLGYRPVPASGLRFRHGVTRHAECWFRDRDIAAIDLHRTIHGTERLDPGAVWAAATNEAGTVDVLGIPIDTPGEAFRLLHLVLHIRPKDRPGSRAWIDLQRAIATIPEERWESAARLATDLGVHDLVGALLRLIPGGESLADRLGLPRRWPLFLRVQFKGRDTTAALFCAEFLQVAWPARFRLVAEWIAPSADQVRAHWPLAARSHFGLALVYISRPLFVPWRLVQMLHSTPPASLDRDRTEIWPQRSLQSPGRPA